ncbi:alpha-protein kinase 1 isoform X3 [Hyla sarda]|nr:alpha-protein kinase 1 isoform X3 [Hyla sarda]XP_056420795.1 alpha-protein kinase 1 isoform X3 [Hyla sarda]XP_056420801.1 alpha-protein kinase 1 isoform X3 [Hyla sarda]XP_056420805.1 alpha-protein kinase 1 isoform X3 [Hyla sarda]XP_056420810.1 alpha-protein kinase 1 isoform X3 [Hyla sarda]
MNNQEVVAVLQECKQMLQDLASEVSEQSEEKKNDYQQCEDSLPDDLRNLIQEAKEMKWPFVPERWQYKQAVGPEDKTNLQDLINPRLHDLLVFLKACILVHDSCTAAAIVFLIDRFLYWADASTRLLSVAKVLHKVWPSTPIAPQVVIRQARISVNSGKLLKAEYILSSLISNNGATGTWNYSKESDKLLVQSVCIQIRGQILQKLGMWYEAAELIWTSIVGFFELPIPDKKGIATSLGILADIFISMSKEDYNRFKKSTNVGLTLLEDYDHRLLSAAEACKLAATFSLYTPLFVLTNLNIRGACLLSYSLSIECPVEKKTYYLSEAKESFHIGLLTKTRGDRVISKQELHSFVKAGFCLVNVHKWLNGKESINEDVNQLCREAMEKLAKYNMLPDKRDKENLSIDIMSLVSSIKEHLDLQPLQNSEANCYVPDSYKDCVKKNLFTRKVSFTKLLDMYSHHHNSVCEVFDTTCNQLVTTDGIRSGACVTALRTSDSISTIDNTSSHTEEKSDQSDEKSARRRKLVRSDAISLSGRSRGGLSRSLNSSRSLSLSNSSFSWEYIPEQKAEEEEGTNAEKAYSTYSSDNLVEHNHADDENIEVNFQGLSIQEDKKSKEQSYSSSYKQPEEIFSNVPGSKSGKCFQNLLKEKTIKNLVSEVSHIADTVQSSDDESFEFVDNFSKTSSVPNVSKAYSVEGKHVVSQSSCIEEKLLNIADLTTATTDIADDMCIGITTSSSIGNAGQTVIHGIDIQAETEDTTHNELPGIFKNNLISTNLPSGPRVHTLIHGIDITAETEDGTDNGFTKMCQNNLVHPDPSRYHAGQAVIHGLETKDTTDDRKHGIADGGDTETNENSNDIHDEMPKNTTNSLVHVGGISEERLLHGIDVEAETKDTTDDAFFAMKASVVDPSGASTSVNGHHICNSTAEDKLLGTDDRLELKFLNQQCSIETSTKRNSGPNQLVNNIDLCESTEEGDDKLNLGFSSGSWSRISNFSGSFSGSNSFLSSSGSSFDMLPGLNTEQVQQARSLDNTDYEALLSGVSHNWLLNRLGHTGIFSSKHSEKTHNALLLKFSKKSELWTAQETVVHIGDYVGVKKEGKQRKAFWIHFLHQDETLGRYIGKAYKKNKELLYHFCDVERQMTAQYYVTEFNKRLYGLNIPTQIFYVPSAVLLMMEGRSIKECVSVEPYILGEFVKLTNNTKIVKTEYEATKYGLAFGHFAYEYFSDIVVDLQGWVTGSEKGEAIIYLTDPQIHSAENTSGATHINFGKYGIYMFFTYQHKECNDICTKLSLIRPSDEMLATFCKSGKKQR